MGKVRNWDSTVYFAMGRRQKSLCRCSGRKEILRRYGSSKVPRLVYPKSMYGRGWRDHEEDNDVEHCRRIARPRVRHSLLLSLAQKSFLGNFVSSLPSPSLFFYLLPSLFLLLLLFGFIHFLLLYHTRPESASLLAFYLFVFRVTLPDARSPTTSKSWREPPRRYGYQVE